MALDPSISLGYRGVELPNQLAQYSQMAQIENAQNQSQVSQMQMQRMRKNEEYLTKMSEAITANGGPDDVLVAARLMAQSPDANERYHGLQLIQSQRELAAYKAKYGAPQAAPAAPVGAMPAAAMPSGALGSGTFGIAQPPAQAPTNALAPQVAPATSQNALGTDVNALRKELLDLSEFPNIRAAQVRAGIIQKQLDEMTKLHVVGRNLVTGGGQKIFESQQDITPSDIRKLTLERDALSPNDPNRKLYDQAIADIGAPNRIAQQRLAFDQTKFAWEKANPNKTIHEDANGLLAIDNRTGVATPVVYGPTGIQPAPVAAPGASMMRQPPAALPGQRTPAIPGMASVLDQVAAPSAAMPLPAESGVRVPGAPVGGKERNLPEHFVKTDMQLANLAGSVNAFKNEVAKNKNTGAKWIPTGEDTANMEAKYISLLMGVKDLYTLGALTGPDLSLIEAQITNPSSWSGKFTTRAGFNAQIKVIEDMVQRGATNLENTYGRVPKGTKKAFESLSSGGGGIPNATSTNPLGLPGL